MSGDAVFCYQGSGIGICIFIEQAVMSHTKSDNYIQVCMRAVEQARLKDRVAHGSSDGFTFLRDTNG